MDNYELLKQWADDKANPLVREITFGNGEELTEEGLPFLLLFHKPDDISSVQRYKSAVMRELMEERGKSAEISSFQLYKPAVMRELLEGRGLYF